MTNNEMKEKAFKELETGRLSLYRSPDKEELKYRYGHLNGMLNAFYRLDIITYTEDRKYAKIIFDNYIEAKFNIETKEKLGN
jgi:hypothetical protein